MASLSSHPNVWETCVQILQRRGAILHVTEDDDAYVWHARIGDFTFTANNPIELLGLVGVYDHLQPTRVEPYWWSKMTKTTRGQPSQVDRLLESADDADHDSGD